MGEVVNELATDAVLCYIVEKEYQAKQVEAKSRDLKK